MPRTVYLGVLAHAGVLCGPTVLSLIQAQAELSSNGFAVTTSITSGNALPDHGRNAMVADFLASEATDLVMVDHDVSWPAGALLKLLGHEVDLVAGVYPRRLDPEDYSVRWNYANPYLTTDPEHPALLEVEAAPTGFMRLTRAGLERMAEHYADRVYTDGVFGSRDTIDLFGSGLQERQFWGEDFAFCKRWREMGGKVFVDPEMTLGHTGQKSFVGALGDWLRQRNDFTEGKERWEAVNAPTAWTTPEAA